MDNTFKLVIGGSTKRSRFTPKEVVIDFATLPEASQRFVVAYGLKQYLGDGTAGAEDQAAFDAGIGQRQDNLVKGDFARKRGEVDAKPDTPEGRALRNIKGFIREQLKAANAKADKAKIDEAAKTLLASDKGKPFLAEAKKQLEAERKLAETVMGAENGNVLAELGIDLEALRGDQGNGTGETED